MKLIFTLFAAVAFSALTAQVFNSPESVEYDAANNRWIVSNTGAGSLVTFDPPSTTVSAFSTLPSSPHGVEVLGNTAYVCDGARIRGYDLTTGTQTFNLNLAASFLNGLTSDGVQYLFATDFSAGGKIYRIDPAAGTFNLMVTTGGSPNGIYYDGANNRCVFITWGSNAAIKAMSLADSTISTLTTSTYSSFDGITRDNAGYWYVTCWGNNSLIRWDPTFTTSLIVMTGLSSPADIDINTAGDSIAIPNSGSTTVVFYTNITTGISMLTETGFSLFPNPAKSDCTITFNAPQFNSEAILTDSRGRVVRKIRFSGTKLVLERGELDAGIYLLNIVNDGGVISSTGKIIFE